MITKYSVKVNTHPYSMIRGISSTKITTLEVERETKTNVWINGKRKTKVTNYEILFDTFDEAKAKLIDVAENYIKHHENRIAEYKKKLKEIDEKNPG